MDQDCAHGCGRRADKYSSGTPECWQCWNRRKLDLPAATHWAEAADKFLSNVDAYDLTKYLPACGLSEDDVRVMLESAIRVRDHSRALLEAGYGPVDDRFEPQAGIDYRGAYRAARKVLDDLDAGRIIQSEAIHELEKVIR